MPPWASPSAAQGRPWPPPGIARSPARYYGRAATRFAARVMLERRLGLAEARYVLVLAEALPRAPDTVALLLRPYCG
jgi:hypothetical protein